MQLIDKGHTQTNPKCKVAIFLVGHSTHVLFGWLKMCVCVFYGIGARVLIMHLLSKSIKMFTQVSSCKQARTNVAASMTHTHAGSSTQPITIY